MTGPDAQARLEALWRQVDARLAAGEFDPASARRVLIEAELVRRASGRRIEGGGGGELWLLEPAREFLVPGPRLPLDLGRLYGGPRLYRPVRDLMLPDTGAFSGPLHQSTQEDPR
jgi:hypothetical protein